MRRDIKWLGIFSSMEETYRTDIQRLIGNFLEDANLICLGMSVVGYEYVDETQPKQFTIINHTNDCNHVDLLVGIDHEWRGVHLWGGMKVRVMWNCNNLFPEAMGIPTRRRLEQAVEEFNDTGEVKTKTDGLATISSAGAETYLRGRVLLNGILRTLN